MATQAARPRRSLALPVFVAQIVIAAALSCVVWFQRLSVAACGGRTCDFEVMLAAGSFFFAVAAGLILAAAAGIISVQILNRRRHPELQLRAAWIPGTGITLTFVSWLISAMIFDAGLYPTT